MQSEQTADLIQVEGVSTIFTGVLFILGSLLVPETYSPVLLRKRAAALSKLTGKVYKSKMEIDQGNVKFSHVFSTALQRPWVLLFREPIVLLLSIYLSIIYGVGTCPQISHTSADFPKILYLLFAAYPVIFQEERGWSQGTGSLPFLAIMIGMILAVTYAIIDNKRYVKINHAHKGFAPAEARLPPACVGAVSITAGLFWFSWTSSPKIHFMAPIAAGVPFGFGMVIVFLSVFSYLIDSYVIYAASVMAANSVLRSLAGSCFPLFTDQMYHRLGAEWASSLTAFLALACMPFPFLFWKYGRPIREKCKYAAQAANFMKALQNQSNNAGDKKNEGAASPEQDEQLQEALDMSYEDEEADREKEKRRRESVRHEAGSDTTIKEDDLDHEHEHVREVRGGFAEMKSEKDAERSGGEDRLRLQKTQSYSGNPFDIDRIATRDSFPGEDRLSRSRGRQ